jgi:uncharacterized cupin superfamily protein
MATHALADHPVHLGRAGLTVVEPRFDRDMRWYMGYAARHNGDGLDGRLVSEHLFTENWGGWERHPHGGEFVYCLSGKLILHQELANGQVETVILSPGDYAINPPGIWHTADIEGETRALFITAGAGTENRPR